MGLVAVTSLIHKNQGSLALRNCIAVWWQLNQMVAAKSPKKPPLIQMDLDQTWQFLLSPTCRWDHHGYASEAHYLAVQSLHVSALETEEAKKISCCVCIDENSLGFGPKLQLLEIPYYRTSSLIAGAQYTEGETGQFGYGLITWKKTYTCSNISIPTLKSRSFYRFFSKQLVFVLVNKKSQCGSILPGKCWPSSI